MTSRCTVDKPLRQGREGVLLPLPTESKLLLVVPIDGYEEKGICQINSVYQLPRDVLICSSNETTSGIADVVGVTTWLSL
jgi:hypothetical protein